MGIGALILLVVLVPLASSRDLRTATKVNRRTAPDPLLVQLFNDPTVTSLNKQTLDDSDDASASGSGMWTVSGNEPKTSDSDNTTETDTKQNALLSSDTATAVELATDQSTDDVGPGSGAEPAAETAAPTKTQTNTEDETVETKDDSITHEDENAKKSSFIPAETETVTDQVEEGGNDVRDSTAAPKGKAFDENNMYDATIVKKNDVPRPKDVKATAKSVIVLSPDERGLAPLTSEINAPQNDQPQQLDQAQQTQQPQQDMTQMAMQSQQDMAPPAMQQPQPDMTQLAMQQQQDMTQAPQQPAAAPQQLTPDASMQGQAQSYAGQYQDPSQQQPAAAAYQDQMIPPATDQALMQGQQANAPVSPINPYADLSMAGQQVDPQTGMPIAGMQAVPVFQGLKAKKITLKEDECEDMYDSCPDMAKNKYCVDYSELMHTQCKKSCGFCKVKDESPESGSESDSSGSLLGDSSASGSAMWNDEDNELPIWRKSGIPSPGDKVVGESASGSAVASDVWSTSASGANMIQGESDTLSESLPEVPAVKKEQTPEVWESGTGQPSEDIGSASGANLAEDLATGTVSKTEKAEPVVTAPKAKYSEIPVPRVIIQQQPAAEIYPRIDLKVIAKAVNAYKSTALRMLGEAIRDAAQEAEDKTVKRTNIPMPPANDLLEKMGFPMEEPRSEVPPFPPPAANPYAQYYQQPMYNNNLQNYYTVQQNSVVKSEVQQPKPKVEKEEKDENKKSSADGPKKFDSKDPFQYVRHMKAGQSMQPIESRPGASIAPYSHSNPIILFKNSQMSNDAAKKNAIPKIPKVAPKLITQAAPAARFGIAQQPKFNPYFSQPKSDVPFDDIFNQDASQVRPSQESAPQYEQQLPTSDNQLDSAMDTAAMMRSETTAAAAQTNNQYPDTQKNTGQGLDVAASFFNNQPNETPSKKEDKINILPESNSYFANQPSAGAATAQIGGKEMEKPDDKSSFSYDAFTKQNSQVADEQQADSLYGSLASKLSIAPEPKDDNMVGMASGPLISQAEISGKIPKKSSMGENNDIDNFSDDVKDDFADDDFDKAQIPQSRGDLPPLNHVHDNEKADNLPPMNHGIEAGALPPLNHGTENAKALPPLNHGMDSGVLPPLNHGKEFASNLPPLNHGYKAESLPPLNHGMENAKALPPLNHGKDSGVLPPMNHGKEFAANLPPLNHGYQAESLPPLNHGMENAKALPPLNHGMDSGVLPPLNHGKEFAANLPPLNHGYQAESLPPLNHGMEAASNLPPLLQGVEQQNILPLLSNDEESVKSYRPPMLPPLEHAQTSPEMNLFYSNPTNTEGSRFKITSDELKNSFQSSPSVDNVNILPPLNHNELPPLRYSSEDKYNDQASTRSNPTPPPPSPIWPYSIPPEGATANQGYAEKTSDQSDDLSDSDTVLFPEGGNPYPTPLPPEGDQSDQPLKLSETKEGSIGKKNLIRPKPDLKCGSGWTGALGDFGTFCYKVVYQQSTWNHARGNCKSAGGDLFSVTNAYEQRFLENFTNIETWLGYRDKSLAGTWRWSDGSKAVYTDWDSSAKDDHGKGRDCVVLDAEEGKWRDASCSQKHSFLCKKSPDDCSKDWKKLTLNSVRGCYKFNDDLKTWSEAQQSCLDDDGTLASVLSDDEQTMVSQVYSKHDMWIGYNDKDNEGDWLWSDRMTSSYTNWDDKSPNNGGVSCAIATRTGKWHDEPCQSKYSYLCKKPSPKSRKDLVNDGFLTQQVQDFITNNTLIPDIDTSVSIFGRSAVAPVYFWTAQKIYKNKIHGSNPIAAHGHIKTVDGGLQLNGVDSWLDAGDFYGQCLGDPDLCIKGFSFATQLNFDDDAASYKDKRYILDSAGDSRGVSIYIQNKTVHYKVAASSKTWDLSTELVTNDWQDVVLTWKKEEGLMLYVNGAFRDSQKDGTTTKAVSNKQARLTIGRKSGNPPYRYTRMYISSLYAFTRFLSPEDIPYVFTYDDTVSARYTWLLPQLKDGKIEGSPEIEVHGPVKAVDGGVYVDGAKSFLKVGNFKDRCLGDPTKCPHGLSLSCKLKLNRVVRSYKDRRYILDSGGHVNGNKGIAAYIDNNNLYFTLAMSTEEDTLRWTVRTSIFTVRWQRVVLTWSLQKGLLLYIDGQFRALTKTPKTIPRDIIDENSEFIIGRKNIGEDYKPAEFSVGSISIFKRFLDKKAVSAVFGEKKMPYPGLIREVWKELPGKEISKLKDDPYYPNDPSLVEIIENFDAPFDVDKDFGSRVKGYFVAPETGNYTFYLSGSKSAELWLSKGESQQNISEMIALHDPTGHNQWNKFTAQISKTVSLEAGKYYYATALEKGTESTDSLSAGVRLPSGRFMRPISKETLQWRLPGDPFAGVIREVWQGISGYKISDLTSNKNFPNNPSSVEVIDKFDAPHNIDDNYGARIRGFFKAPETGKYRFYLAADTTGELWLSTDENESNVKKIVTINGWTDHNQWLKFPEQKSEHTRLKKGHYYYFEAYHKADKLADCASVAVEFPSGHFEGPIKRVHLSWRLPDGITGPGPSSEQEAIPKPVGLYPLTKNFGAKDASGNNDNGILSNVKLSDGPDGSPGGAYEFAGKEDSYVEIPKSKLLDAKHSLTVLANIYPTGNGGPIINYKTDGWGVHLWQFESNELFVRFVHRNGVFHKPIGSRVIELNTWNQVGATYDNSTGVAKLWHNGKMVKSRNIGQIRLATQYPIRIGARDGDDRRFSGKIACVQIYGKSMDQQQIGNLKVCPVKSPVLEEDESGSSSGSGLYADVPKESDHIAVAFSHEAGKYDKDEEADDLIQGSEFVTGYRKCDPNPCENEGRCLKDGKRLDGYRCKCSSDFTGRNCQVSKPDAENPVVKRTKIPRAEKKQGSEKYQKNSTSNGVIEQMRKEKKEDVLLLFQKLGCYTDNPTRHDIPTRAYIKSVSQEDCVRTCALKEQGFSYFGLQDSNQCYCGHGFGKYGRADESLCDKRCNGNNDENCGGKSTNMVYFFGLGTNYTVKVYTGDKEEADSDAKVYITLYGKKGDSGFRKLSAKTFTKKEDVSETLLLPELGELKKLRILHDNSGKHPSWFLKKVTVTDENGKAYSFPCKEWLSETRGGGKTERLLFVENAKQS